MVTWVPGPRPGIGQDVGHGRRREVRVLVGARRGRPSGGGGDRHVDGARAGRCRGGDLGVGHHRHRGGRVPPKSTPIAPVRADPVTVTPVPPPAGPSDGWIPETTGGTGGAWYVYWSATTDGDTPPGSRHGDVDRTAARPARWR